MTVCVVYVAGVMAGPDSVYVTGNALADSYDSGVDPVARRSHKHSNLGFGVAVGVPAYECYVCIDWLCPVGRRGYD